MEAISQCPPAPARALSNEFGTGASAYREEDLIAWKELGAEAQNALKARSWLEANRLAVAFCELRPQWPKGYLLRQRVMTQLCCPFGEVSEMLHRAIDLCEGRADCGQLKEALATLEKARCSPIATDADAIAAQTHPCPSTDSTAEKVIFLSRVKGLKLLPHEQTLVEARQLEDITHPGASAIWLSAESTPPSHIHTSFVLVYRPMGDEECSHLLTHGILPDTQPYQTIVQGGEGRIYAEKYLRGHKSVDSSPTTVVEFCAPLGLIHCVFAMQSKNEDGAISHGLGNKGGKGLHLFNESLQRGDTSYRIVFVKRFEKKAVGAFGAGRRKT